MAISSPCVGNSWFSSCAPLFLQLSLFSFLLFSFFLNAVPLFFFFVVVFTVIPDFCQLSPK